MTHIKQKKRVKAGGGPIWSLVRLEAKIDGGLAGNFSQQEKDPHLPVFRKILENVRHGQRVTFPGYDWIENQGKAPNIWIRQDDDGKRMLGLINWSGESLRLRVTAEDLQVPPKTKLENLFTGERKSLPLDRPLSNEDAELWKTES